MQDYIPLGFLVDDVEFTISTNRVLELFILLHSYILTFFYCINGTNIFNTCMLQFSTKSENNKLVPIGSSNVNVWKSTNCQFLSDGNFSDLLSPMTCINWPY